MRKQEENISKWRSVGETKGALVQCTEVEEMCHWTSERTKHHHESSLIQRGGGNEKVMLNKAKQLRKKKKNQKIKCFHAGGCKFKTVNLFSELTINLGSFLTYCSNTSVG